MQPVNNNGAQCRCVGKHIEAATELPATEPPNHEGNCSCAEGGSATDDGVRRGSDIGDSSPAEDGGDVCNSLAGGQVCRRSVHNPVISPASDPLIGDNINGPSVIEVPDWVDPATRLGGGRARYYMYFAHHDGLFIRVAYSVHSPMGPWTVQRSDAGGVLHVSDTHFNHGTPHIASPDVHVDHERRAFHMVFHGNGGNIDHEAMYASSTDGLSFTALPEPVGRTYLRVFRFAETWWGVARQQSLVAGRMEIAVYRVAGGGASDAPSGVHGRFTFASSIAIPNEDFSRGRPRHFAVQVRSEELDVYYTQIGDAPERIKRVTIPLGQFREHRHTATGFPSSVTSSAVLEVLWPEADYEGADREVQISTGGASYGPVRQVRDPYVHPRYASTSVAENGVNEPRYLFYSVAGEHGIGAALLRSDAEPTT